MKLAIQRADGGVSILTLIEGGKLDDEIEKWKSSAPGEYLSHREIEDADIPTDRTFRDAWAIGRTGINVDMPKAREIHRDRMRAARAPKLAALDIEFQRALEDGKTTVDVVSAKQALRDVTKHPDIDKAMTPEELKQVWPEVIA